MLDEATSALDWINKAKVQSSLDLILKEKTRITISHRMDTIRNSDEIILLSKGSITEKGIYRELMEKGGHVFKLKKGL